MIDISGKVRLKKECEAYQRDNKGYYYVHISDVDNIEAIDRSAKGLVPSVWAENIDNEIKLS